MSSKQSIQAVIAEVQQMNAVAAQMSQAAAQRIGIGVLDLQAVQLLRMAELPLTASDLARSIGISTAAATGLVDRLVAAGLVRRVPDSGDRRRTIIVLAGDRVAGELGPAFSPLLQRWAKTLSGYTDAQLALVGDVIAALTEAIGHEVGALRKG